MEFLREILINIIGNLLSAVILLLIGTVIWLCASNLQTRTILAKRDPQVIKDKTLSKAVEQGHPIRAKYRVETSFRRVLSDWEIDFLVEYYNFTTGRDAYDGRCLRLDGYEVSGGEILLTLSPVGFFDLITTNLSFFPGNIRTVGPWKRIASWTMLPKYYAILSERRHQILGHLDPKDPNLFEKTIANRKLANALAISVNILDFQGNTLVVRRPRSITVAADTYSVAVTGTLTEADLFGETGSVLTRGAARETLEEFGLPVDPAAIRPVDIIMTPQKFQPTALLEVQVATDLKSIATQAQRGKDFVAEAAALYVLNLRDPAEFFSVTRRLPFSPASVYALDRAFARVNSLDDSEFLCLKKQYRPSPALATRWEKHPVFSVEPQDNLK
ncbi:MAG: hypothetical protein ACPLRW_04755 [Moorellales bacterium]